MLGIYSAAGLLFLLTYFILLPITRYFRDPKGLRRFQKLSPFAGITDLAFVYEAHRGFRSQALLEAHKHHPIVRIGPNSLSYSDPRAIRDIYGHGTPRSKDRFYSTLASTHSHLADVIDKPHHANKRKMLAGAYAIKNLERWEYKVSNLTRKMMTAFDARCTSPLSGARPAPEDLTIDFRHWTNMFTICAIASIGLSEDLKFLENGNDLVTSESPDGSTRQVPFRECLFSMAWATSNLVWAYDYYSTLVRLSKLFSSRYRKCWRLTKDWDGIVYNRVTTRMKRYEAGEKLDDFFSAMMNDKSGHPNMLEMGEIVADTSIMMNAGSDTTGIALNNVMYLLLKKPATLAKLRLELDSTLDNEEDVVPPYDKVKHLPYLRAVLDESLRILTPVSFGLPRRTPPEGMRILDDWIPGDTSVSISAYILHHNPAVFPEPGVFKPERWLGDAGRDLQSNFIAFSTGARGCIGRNISYLEQSVLLACLVRRYEFALPHPKWEPTRRENTTLSPGPMWLKIWRRSDVKL